MKVLVQRCDTGQYCMRRDGWTNDCDEAQDFETSVRALDFCRKSDVANAQVVLKFETGRSAMRTAVMTSCFRPQNPWPTRHNGKLSSQAFEAAFGRFVEMQGRQ